MEISLFFYMQIFSKSDIQNDEVKSLNEVILKAFFFARSEKKISKNCQIYIFGFQCAVVNIES
jgi:hypothetical protein